MMLIGIGVIGSLGYSFISAAPDFRISEYHKASLPAEQCMQCHIQGVKEIPIIFKDRLNGYSKIPRIEILRTLKNLFLIKIGIIKK